MSPSCPISTRRVDSNMVRLISMQVALFTVILLFTHEVLFAFVLLFDFSVRVLRKPTLSPFHQVAKFVLQVLDLPPKFCDESPKRFALYLGLSVSATLVVLSTAGLEKVAAAITIILLLCALLETLFDYCIGCKLYYTIQIMSSLKNRRISKHSTTATHKL